MTFRVEPGERKRGLAAPPPDVSRRLRASWASRPIMTRGTGHARAAALLLLLGAMSPAFVPGPLHAQSANPSAVAAPAAWVQRSNENAQLLIEPLAKFNPEMAGQFGVDGMDDQIIDLKPKVNERANKALEGALAALRQRLQAEKDPLVKQDLEILIQSAEIFLEQGKLTDRYMLPYFDMSQTVFMGMRLLLEDQVPAERRAAALVRLRRYAGLEPGYTPVTQLAMDRTRERFAKKGLLGPVKAEVERNLENTPRYVAGIGKLFAKYEISGSEEAQARIAKQLTEYDEFVREEVLPRAREDFRQPPEMYAASLRLSGIDMPVEELVSRAQTSFRDIQNQLQSLAPLVAQSKGLAVTDYRDVIRELKKEQLVGEAILPHYEARIKDVERIIREQHIVTLPAREMRVRLASEAESAMIPAPNMHPPRLIGNTGEMGEFLLPLRIPGKAGESKEFDDFTYAAASWTLTAHEGRPGHELQFASLIERGVSIARALFALNSTNVEGWGLYAENEMQPYMPIEGQLVCMQHRLMRAARAILDPGLQLGKITEEEAFRVLREDCVLSDAMATQEVQRYTFLAPGQAPSYYCGWSRLLEIRAEAERVLGKGFDRQKYHDFLLAQGTLPPKLLRKAVLEDFIPQQKSVTQSGSAPQATTRR